MGSKDHKTIGIGPLDISILTFLVILLVIGSKKYDAKLRDDGDIIYNVLRVSSVLLSSSHSKTFPSNPA